jgi:hypothetical protein
LGLSEDQCVLRKCTLDASSWKASRGQGQFLENRPVVYLQLIWLKQCAGVTTMARVATLDSHRGGVCKIFNEWKRKELSHVTYQWNAMSAVSGIVWQGVGFKFPLLATGEHCWWSLVLWHTMSGQQEEYIQWDVCIPFLACLPLIRCFWCRGGSTSGPLDL